VKSTTEQDVPSVARGLNVGILGGSIAGCAVAAELDRAGCNVTVLERSGEEAKDRGAGVGVPLSLVTTMVARGLVDADMPHLRAHRFPRVVRDEVARDASEERYGRVLWDQPGSIALLNWGDLYRNLRSRVPEGAYRTRCNVTALRENAGETVTVAVGGGRTRDFDLVVCADGYRSLGRRTLFPDLECRYAGFVLWRGVLEEKDLPEAAPLEGAMAWPSYLGGHGPFFLVPGPGGALAPGRRLVSWGLYLSVTEIERAELLTGDDQAAHEGPAPRHALRPTREARLKAWVREALPEYYAEIVENSRHTFAQTIYESPVPSYRKGRICLVGDAGALARPHTGTGVLKGVADAIALAGSLARGPSLEIALARWSDAQTAHGNDLVRLGSQVGRALVAHRPGGSPTDATSMEQWFSRMVTVPFEVFAP
jgi:2-polyprenyl-6-methoxyphenol hydroxylase-like FAD-dependent oxidoreductase